MTVFKIRRKGDKLYDDRHIYLYYDSFTITIVL